jgi:hypothetical protein
MANPTPYAANAFGVNARPMEATVADAPSTQYYHGGTIVVNNNIIGRINSWHSAGAYNREGNHVYEISKQTWGLPVDYVPGRAVNFNITFTRAEVWTQELEITLGYGQVWENLTDQTRPFTANEMLFRGLNIYRTWSHRGCWFQEKNPEAWESEGNGIIRVSCNMVYVSRKRTF